MRKDLLLCGVLFLAVCISGAAQAAEAGREAVSKVWPVSDDHVAWMIENLPNVEHFACPADAKAPKAATENFLAVIEVPAYIELVSLVTGSNGTAVRKVEEIERDGRPYRRYTLPPPLSHAAYFANWSGFFWSQWVPRPTEADRRQPGVFAWHFVTPGGTEPEQKYPIRLLPELPAVPPCKRLTVIFDQCSAFAYVEKGHSEPVMKLLSRAGFNVVCTGEPDELRTCHLSEKGIRIGGGFELPRWSAPSPEPDYKDFNCRSEPTTLGGTDDHGKQDFQWIIDTQGEPWKKDLAAAASWPTPQCEVVIEDIEWGSWLFDSGFSPAGIRAFAKKNNLDAAKLTAPIIWKDYRKQWNDFRAEQFLLCMRLYYQAAKKANPNVRYGFCPQTTITSDENLMSNLASLGKDQVGRPQYLALGYPLDRLQECSDFIVPMWYGPGADQARDAFNWSKALTPRVKVDVVPFYSGQSREFYLPYSMEKESLRANAWAGVLGGTKGYAFWLCEFSPLQLSWLARASRELARVEDILLDGMPDVSDVSVTFMPKRTFSTIKDGRKTALVEPDFAANTVWRTYKLGEQRLATMINLDERLDLFAKVRFTGLPKGDYRALLVCEEQLLVPSEKRDLFSAEELAEGVVVTTPARMGVTAILVERVPAAGALPDHWTRQPAAAAAQAYEKYREPDAEGAVLAEHGGISVREEIIKGQKAILVDCGAQQIWIRPDHGAMIEEWRIKHGNRTVVESGWWGREGGVAKDIFYVPTDMRFSEQVWAPYELVSASVHAGCAWLEFRHVLKEPPQVGGLVITKKYIVPEQGTDVFVEVEVTNANAAKSMQIAFWANHVFHLGPNPVPGNTLADCPEVYLQTAKGVALVPKDKLEILWAKPGAPITPGQEDWEKATRCGETTGDWIAQRNPDNGEMILCQVETPSVTQFSSYRYTDVGLMDQLTLEWMCPAVRLDVGKSWNTKYLLRYMADVKPSDIPAHLIPTAP